MPTKLYKFLLICFLSVTGLTACRDKNQDEIPNVLVDIQVNINNPGYISLQVTGGWMYFDGGSRGIIVYRKSPDEFVALERHCSYEPSQTCGQVRVDTSSNVIAVDDCCGSRFLLIDGSVNTGPATRNLKLYQTYYDGSALLRIYN